MERFKDYLRTYKKSVLAGVGALALVVPVAGGVLAAGSGSTVGLSATLAQAQEDGTTVDEGGAREDLQEGVGDGTSEGTTSGGGGSGGGSLSEGANNNVTFALRLESARIEKVDLDDDDLEFVRYEFAQAIQAINDQDGFKLRGLDSNEEVTADEALRDEDSLNAVIAGFPRDTDLASFTLAVVDAEAVENVSGEGNPPDAIALGGSTVSIQEGRTDGPDLLDVNIHPSLERAELVFDENLNEDMTPSASDIGYYTLDGQIHTADRVVSIEDEILTAVFDESDGDQVEEAVAWFVLEDALEDHHGNGNVLSSVGGRTTAPDLVSVNEALGETQYDFVFDTDITNADPGMFMVFTADGQRWQAESVSRPDSDTVRAAFPDIFEFRDEILLGAVESGAVQADTGFETPNTVGSEPISSSRLGDGATTGPDLERVSIDEATGQIVFTFDELVEDQETWNPDDFFVITSSGALLAGENFVEVDGHDVIVTFDPTAVQAALGVVVDDGAVEDFQGNPNPMDAVEI